MKRYIKSTMDIFASSMKRIKQHLESENVATITSFITSDDSNRTVNPYKRSEKENRRSNRDLSADLQALKYGFTKIDGYWRESNSDVAVREKSYYVICPKNITFDTFKDTLIALARKYEQQGVVIWSYEAQKAYLYLTDDYKQYYIADTFDTFNDDVAKDEVWSEWHKRPFAFDHSADNPDFTLESATEIGNIGASGPADMYGYKYFKKRLLEEYGDQNY